MHRIQSKRPFQDLSISQNINLSFSSFMVVYESKQKQNLLFLRGLYYLEKLYA